MPTLTQEQLILAQAELSRRGILEKVQRSPVYWLQTQTRTFDEHWESAGLASPYSYFPRYEYFSLLFRFLSQDPAVSGTTSKVRIIAKSRDLMATWSCVGKLTHLAMTRPSKVIALQSQNKEKSEELVRYSKALWNNQPQFLKESYPLKKGYRMEDFPKDGYEYANGSRIVGIPEGADQVRSSHPSALLMDEAGFQPEGQGAFDTAYPACEFIIVLSTAWPGWFRELACN